MAREYAYLRCQGCRSGGRGVPDPQGVYNRLTDEVLRVLGDFPVVSREYARGGEVRKQVEALQERVSYYMKGLEPGGRLTVTSFSRQQAEAALDAALAELAAIDPSTAEDRWVWQEVGMTFRERWEEGGVDQMTEDLVRAGITATVSRVDVPGKRAPDIALRIRVPKDVRERLVQKADDFASPV